MILSCCQCDAMAPWCLMRINCYPASSGSHPGGRSVPACHASHAHRRAGWAWFRESCASSRQHHRPGFARCEALPIGACGLEDALASPPLTLRDLPEYRNQIHAIAVRPSRKAANATLGINGTRCASMNHVSDRSLGLLRQTQGLHQTDKPACTVASHAGQTSAAAPPCKGVVSRVASGRGGVSAYRAPTSQ